MDEATLRTLFPEITDEAIALRQAAAVESKKQSLRDQIANHTEQATTLQAELDSLTPAEVPSEEVPVEAPQG